MGFGIPPMLAGLSNLIQAIGSCLSGSGWFQVILEGMIPQEVLACWFSHRNVPLQSLRIPQYHGTGWKAPQKMIDLVQPFSGEREHRGGDGIIKSSLTCLIASFKPPVTQLWEGCSSG